MSARFTARVLIVDDEPAQVQALSATLTTHGFVPAGATTAAQALEKLHQVEFDLLLTDLGLPDMDGISLLQLAERIDPHLVGIVMTGHGTIDSAVAAMQAGALDYIQKPFKLSAILPVLSRALTLRQLRIQNERLEAGIRERTGQLEAVNAELDSFAASIAHDLNAPARNLANYARLILETDGSALTPETRRHLQAIGEGAERMGRLITDLLEFSRLTRVDLRHESVDLNQIVAAVRDELTGETRGRTIAWNCAELPVVQGDGTLLRQVYANLLSNAVKYTRRRPVAEIEVGLRREDGARPVFFVRDNGAGFDSKTADNLFGMFQRLHAASDFEGHGVGLANVRRIVQRHGGRVWAESAVDCGATFFFTLAG